MNFSTPIPLRQSKFLIDYNSKIISLGSCFAENIGEKLNYFKFRNITNPFGIIFNPISIEKLVEREVKLQRLVTVYIVTGLLFMLLPGTFLGVWNLISISGRQSLEEPLECLLRGVPNASDFDALQPDPTEARASPTM